MIPLRFRSLGDRKSIAAVFILACVSTHAHGNASTVEELHTKLLEDCEKALPENMRIFEDKDRANMVDKFDPRLQCQANSGEEQDSHNAHMVTAEIWKKRPAWVFAEKREEAARRVGACKKNYQAIKAAHDYYSKLRSDYCKALETRMNAAISKGEPSKKNEWHYKLVKEVFGQYSKKSKEFSGEMKLYFSATAKASEEAAKKYEADLKILDSEFRAHPQIMSSKTAPTTLEGHPLLKPANGNLQTKSLVDYYYALLPAEVQVAGAQSATPITGRGRLITEQEEAKKRALAYLSDLESLLAETGRTNTSAEERWDSMLAGIEKSGPADGKDGISKITTYTPALTQGTKLAGDMFGSQQGPAAAAAITAASGTPSLAAIGAAAAAGAMLSSSIGASSSGGSLPAAPVIPQEAATSFSPTPAAKLDDGANAGGALPAVSNELPATSYTSEGGKVDTAAAPAFPAFGAGEGTSRAIAGSKKEGRNPSQASKPADVGLSDDGFANFGSRGMDPKPGPKGAATSPGAEVANLLGQMKDLFNFDEGAPMGGAPGNMGAGYAPEAPLDPNLAGGMENEPGSEGLAGEESYTAESGESGEGRTEVQGTQFGRVDTSLFKRIRQRHTRCMERGLVLYQLRERVE